MDGGVLLGLCEGTNGRMIEAVKEQGVNELCCCMDCVRGQLSGRMIEAVQEYFVKNASGVGTRRHI